MKGGKSNKKMERMKATVSNEMLKLDKKFKMNVDFMCQWDEEKEKVSIQFFIY